MHLPTCACYCSTYTPVPVYCSTYTGVSEQNGRFKAEIWNAEGTEKEYLGSYNTADIAAHAYNRRALELGKAQNTIKSNEPKATRARQPLRQGDEPKVSG